MGQCAWHVVSWRYLHRGPPPWKGGGGVVNAVPLEDFLEISQLQSVVLSNNCQQSECNPNVCLIKGV
jgi:hypothetical protein